jgi:hypothetical protein
MKLSKPLWKIAGLFTILLLLMGRAYADEGMWLPMLLGQKVYDNMVKRGLKLTKDQLYSINKASLKDAVVIFGNGCTGEIVSNLGLIFTNHHCGYEAVAGLSTVEHNYLHDGFYARSLQEELPGQGLSVQFLDSVVDVTAQVEAQLQGLSAADRMKRQSQIISDINAKYSDPSAKTEGRVSVLYKGNQFLVFVYTRYTDIRLVGIPPESVGKFGGETDNWEWPRHNGDFSVWRVYANHEGKSADYSPDNIPLKPKYALPVSLKGVKEGDYAMIFGYPGSTNRYETSFGVKLKTDVEDPAIVNLRDVRLKLMMDRMKTAPAVRLQLASSYAGIANYWKFYDGERKQLLKYDVYGQKQADEAKFTAWAADKPEFSSVFSDYSKAYAGWSPYAKTRIYTIEGILGSPLMQFCGSLVRVEQLLTTAGKEADAKRAIDSASRMRDAFLKEEDQPSDLKILAAMTQMFYTDIPRDQYPVGFFEGIKNKYGDLGNASTFNTYASAVFSNTFVFSDAKWKAFVANPDANVLQEDPAYAQASAFVRSYNGRYAPIFSQFMATTNNLGRLYIKGSMLQFPDKLRYPDATFTMRVSYGNVKSYNPRDAVHYDYACTMKGILEKYVPGDYEFDLPAKFLDLAHKQDYGMYKDPIKNDLAVTFITTNDITGGNSGSPVLNDKGELIGLAFDGNYEALSHKVAYDPVYNRTICVDIRYVLWCIDKLGGADNLIKELKLVKGV